MRVLGNDRIKILIQDGITKDTHTLYCREPTTEEKIKYRIELIQMKDGKVDAENLFKTRIKYASMVLIGFEKGTLKYDGKIISSDPNDSDYYAEWKSLFEKYLSDILELIAQKIFETQGEVISEDFFTGNS